MDRTSVNVIQGTMAMERFVTTLMNVQKGIPVMKMHSARIILVHITVSVIMVSRVMEKHVPMLMSARLERITVNRDLFAKIESVDSIVKI